MPGEEEDRKLHRSTQAKTEKLIGGDEISSLTTLQITPEMLVSPTEAVFTPSPETQASTAGQFDTQVSFTSEPHSQSTTEISKPELTGTMYFDERSIPEKQIANAPLPILESALATTDGSDNKLFWVPADCRHRDSGNKRNWRNDMAGQFKFA